MPEPVQNFTILRYDGDAHALEEMTRPIVVEHACELIVNGDKWLTFICSPDHLEALGIGFLWNEAVLTNLNQVEHLELSEDGKSLSVRLKMVVEKPKNFHRTSTGIAIDQPHLPTPNKQDFAINAADVLRLYREFNQLQELHDAVGGFHSGALSDGQKINFLVEDVGRHNCIDKLAGLYLQAGREFAPKLLLISGRISSEMVAKSLSLGVVLLVSRTSPTSLAIQTARQAGITLVGYLRGHQYFIYTHPEKVIV